MSTVEMIINPINFVKNLSKFNLSNTNHLCLTWDLNHASGVVKREITILTIPRPTWIDSIEHSPLYEAKSFPCSREITRF
jgi:hypothetical protein